MRLQANKGRGGNAQLCKGQLDNRHDRHTSRSAMGAETAADGRRVLMRTATQGARERVHAAPYVDVAHPQNRVRIDNVGGNLHCDDPGRFTNN